MTSRKQQREEARAQRQAREQAASAQAARRRRLLQLAGLVGVVVVAIAIVVAVQSGGESSDGGGATEVTPETQELFAGIAQEGTTLGKSSAPVTMQEFADLQCPFCREYTVDVLPTLIRDYVRTGKVRMVFHPVAFLGEDSEPAARAALAAGRQNLLWQFVDAFYRNQQEENSGYVTDDFLRKVGAAVPNLDVQTMMSEKDSAAVTAQLTEAQSQSDELKVQGTPSFFLNSKGQAPADLPVSQLTPDEFTSALDSALGN